MMIKPITPKSIPPKNQPATLRPFAFAISGQAIMQSVLIMISVTIMAVTMCFFPPA